MAKRHGKPTPASEVIRAIEGLEPPFKVEVRAAGAFPTVIEAAPTGALDVGFKIEGEGETSARKAGAKGGKTTGRLMRTAARRWQERAIALAKTEIAKDRYITNDSLALKVLDQCKPCPEYHGVYKFIAAERKDGRPPPRLSKSKT